MTPNVSDSTERLADHFVNYLFDEYKGTKHVRRVATWIGFLLKAVEGVAGGTIRLNRKRQVTFEYDARQFKARYNHKAGVRGGIDVVEVLPLQGSPDGPVIVSITSLAEAEAVYQSLQANLDAYVGNKR